MNLLFMNSFADNDSWICQRVRTSTFLWKIVHGKFVKNYVERALKVSQLLVQVTRDMYEI